MCSQQHILNPRRSDTARADSRTRSLFAVDAIRRTSLQIYLVGANGGIGWICWYVRIDPNGKAGQVVGNIVSEWSQILSIVSFTKYLIERGSEQSYG